MIYRKPPKNTMVSTVFPMVSAVGRYAPGWRSLHHSGRHGTESRVYRIHGVEVSSDFMGKVGKGMSWLSTT